MPARCTPTGRTSTGRQSAGSTAATATATWSAPAHRPVRSSQPEPSGSVRHRYPDVDPAFLGKAVPHLEQARCGDEASGKQGLTLAKSRRLRQHRSRDETEQVGEVIQVI